MTRTPKHIMNTQLVPSGHGGGYMYIVYSSRSLGWSLNSHQEKHAPIAAEMDRLENLTGPGPGMILAYPG